MSYYSPRIEQGNTIQTPELFRAASPATGQVEGVFDYGIMQLHDQIIAFTRSGRAAKGDGLGTGDRLPGWTVVLISNIAPTLRLSTA